MIKDVISHFRAGPASACAAALLALTGTPAFAWEPAKPV